MTPGGVDSLMYIPRCEIRCIGEAVLEYFNHGDFSRGNFSRSNMDIHIFVTHVNRLCAHQ